MRFRLGHVGSSASITNAIWEQENKTLATSPSLDHLPFVPLSSWAPSIALALGLSKSLPLYHQLIDHHLTSLATHAAVPCRVPVTLGLLADSEAPHWQTKYNPNEYHIRNLLSFEASSRARKEARMLSPERANIARRERLAERFRQFCEQSRTDRGQVKERGIECHREAVGSSRLDAVGVTNTTLKWLRTEKLVDKDTSVKSAVETLLVDLIGQKEHTMSVCTVFELWPEWSDRGGMTINDLEHLEKNKAPFCNAACIMGLFREVCTKEESMVALDMRECVQHWKKVRLG